MTAPADLTGTPLEWRPIPGYGGAYEISWSGQVRSYRYKGRLLERPKLLHQYKHLKHGNQPFVKLTEPDGRGRDRKVMQLIIMTFLGGIPAGKVAYHKNGNPLDNAVSNIGFATRRELGRLTGTRCNRRIPVAKIDRDGNVLALYPSAREAAKHNYMSYQSIMDRCNGKVKNEYALDGTTYRWDK